MPQRLAAVSSRGVPCAPDVQRSRESPDHSRAFEVSGLDPSKRTGLALLGSSSMKYNPHGKVPTHHASERKEDVESMVGTELAAVLLFGSLPLAPSQIVGKQDPAKSYGQNLAAATQNVAQGDNGARSKWPSRNCLPGLHRRPLPGPQKRCGPPQKAQPAGPF